MIVAETPLSGVLVLEPQIRRDDRGFLIERYSEKRYEDVGVKEHFVQDNHARSVGGSLRGLHFQVVRPHAKLVDVSRGKIFDVAVDIRLGSPTFGQWHGVILGEETFRQIYIPVGFAHGFCVLSEVADIHYKFSDYYSPEHQRGIAWDDPVLGIDWPIRDPTLSQRDSRHPRLEQLDQSDLLRGIE